MNTDQADALLSLNKQRILDYCNKRGIPLPDNELSFWAGVHKAIYLLPVASAEQKEASKQWLLSHGLSTNIY